jgi:hypothetical protein
VVCFLTRVILLPRRPEREEEYGTQGPTLDSR